MQMNRITPSAPVQAYQTYRIHTPPDRLVKAACEQVGCAAWARGWDSVVDESTDLGQRQAAYIRTQSGRTFRELHKANGLTVFRFQSGQRCFQEHRTRPELYLVRDGDWRGNPTGRQRQHQNARDWIEDFGEHQQCVSDQREKG
ncbi:hypothetical protein [Streptomyces boncukensis]|uniref:Uncharacterized protein n=1 Tax=Streptomyces boncukensis TaxID=2711219 RepID=A0A6G4WTB8_9ACTN|nr:hypothetical protein [Streptomyces boncukensis]NGO68516.1 hypothetical protein [Streptomyces boncukensis]